MLYKYVYDRGFVVWNMIHLHGNNGCYIWACRPEKCTSMQIFSMEYLQQRNDPSCMIIRLCGSTLYPVMDVIFGWIKENTPSLCLCSTHKSNKRCLTQLSVHSGSQRQPSCKYLQPALSPTIIPALTLHLPSSLNSVMIRVDSSW